MKRGEILQNLFAIAIIVAVLLLLWNTLGDTASTPIQIDPQRLFFLQLMQYGIAASLAILGLVLSIIGQGKECQKCQWWNYSWIHRRTCPNCGEKYR